MCHSCEWVLLCSINCSTLHFIPRLSHLCWSGYVSVTMSMVCQNGCVSIIMGMSLLECLCFYVSVLMNMGLSYWVCVCQNGYVSFIKVCVCYVSIIITMYLFQWIITLSIELILTYIQNDTCGFMCCSHEWVCCSVSVFVSFSIPFQSCLLEEVRIYHNKNVFIIMDMYLLCVCQNGYVSNP